MSSGNMIVWSTQSGQERGSSLQQGCKLVWKKNSYLSLSGAVPCVQCITYIKVKYSPSKDWRGLELNSDFFFFVIVKYNILTDYFSLSNSLMSRIWEFSLLCFSFSQLIRPINAIVNISLEHLYWYLKWSLHWMRSMHNIRQKRLVLPSVERRKSQCTFR